MRKLIPFIILLFVAMGATAQISVESFVPLPTDMTATSLENKRTDRNGDACALIKIVTPETDFTFEGGTLGVVDSKQENGEVWVWVPRGLKKITIKHQVLGVLRDYRFPCELESERTYEMKLITAEIQIIKKKKETKQYLTFEVNPKDATLEVNDVEWILDEDGTQSKYMDWGTYTYRVTAPHFHPEVGKVTLNSNDTKILPVTLKPAYGWIQVPAEGNLRNAVVYIDGTRIGVTPQKSDILDSGKHTVRIVKDMYLTYTDKNVVVSDNQVTTVAPQLEANFTEITLRVDADAEIWVDFDKKGVRSWSGPLEKGEHKVECKLENHETSSQTINVKLDSDDNVFELPKPMPIYGSLNIATKPNLAEIFIDGESVGNAPKYIPEILIGTHRIKVRKKDYIDHEETITIVRDQPKELNIKLSQYDVEKFNSFIAKATEAKNKGNFDMAVDHYRDAQKVHDDPEIEDKIKLVRGLKDKFPIIDNYIKQKEYSQAESLISQVLKDDPGNPMATSRKQKIDEEKNKERGQKLKEVLDKIDSAINNWRVDEAEKNLATLKSMDPYNSQIAVKTQAIEDLKVKVAKNRKKEKWRRITYGFRGDRDKQDNLGGLHLEFGWSRHKVQFVNSEIGNDFRTKLYYANYRYLPFTIDLNLDYGKDLTSFGVGLGSAFTLGGYDPKVAFTYGVGWRTNQFSLDGDYLGSSNNFYYALGLTWMFHNPGWGGLSYTYEHSFGETVLPVSKHNVSYICGKHVTGWMLFLAGLVGMYYVLGSAK